MTKTSVLSCQTLTEVRFTLKFQFTFQAFIMKQIVANQKVKIPDGLTVHVKSRLVTVKGPRGVLKRNFKHLAVDIRMVNPRLLKVEKWFGSKKELAAVRTVCSHVENMIKGKVTFCLFDNLFKCLYCYYEFDLRFALFRSCSYSYVTNGKPFRNI